MGRPKALDLFCGAGGASMGLHRAGFDVTGVDIRPQPRYPFTFVQADALEFPLDGTVPCICPTECDCQEPDGGLLSNACPEHNLYPKQLDECSAHDEVRPWDFIWASPPCQGYTLMQHMGKRAGEGAPRLIEPVRKRLQASGTDWVIENVVGAPLRNPIVLCGSMFGLGVRRHRLFESSMLLLQMSCNHEPNRWPIAVWGDGRPSRQEARREHRGPIAVYGDHPEDSAIHRASDNRQGLTRRAATLQVGQAAMGIGWMAWNELTESIPPAYSEFIGKQALQFLNRQVTYA